MFLKGYQHFPILSWNLKTLFSAETFLMVKFSCRNLSNSGSGGQKSSNRSKSINFECQPPDQYYWTNSISWKSWSLISWNLISWSVPNIINFIIKNMFSVKSPTHKRFGSPSSVGIRLGQHHRGRYRVCIERRRNRWTGSRISNHRTRTRTGSSIYSPWKSAKKSQVINTNLFIFSRLKIQFLSQFESHLEHVAYNRVKSGNEMVT